MYTFITILIAVVCVFMILVVLIQKPKGGVAANFGGTTQSMGVQRTTDVVEKTTWVLSIGLFSLALLINFWIPREETGVKGQSLVKDKIDNLAVPVAPAQKQPAAAPSSGSDTSKK